VSQVTRNRNEIHRKIIELLKSRDMRSEEMLKALGLIKNCGERRKALRERKEMLQDGTIFKVGEMYTLKKPEKAHMQAKTVEFIGTLEGCKYSERERFVDNIKFSASIFVKSEGANKRDLNQGAEKFLKDIIGSCSKGLDNIDLGPFKLACIVCVTNQN